MLARLIKGRHPRIRGQQTLQMNGFKYNIMRDAFGVELEGVNQNSKDSVQKFVLRV